VVVPGNNSAISLTSIINDFYGPYGERAVKAFEANPDKYFTRFLRDGLIAYELSNFDTINIKLLIGDLRTIRDLIHPLRKCNLYIRVPQGLRGYLSDLETLGFKIQSGKDLLLLNRSGDNI